MKKRNPENAGIHMLLGIALVVTSIVILLMNIRVSSFGFYRLFGTVNSAPILLIVLVFLVIWAVISGKLLPVVLAGIDILAIIVSVLVGSHFMFVQMNALTLIAIFGMLAVGIGLILLSGIEKKKEKDKE